MDFDENEAIALLKMVVDNNTVNPPGNEKILADKICDYLQGTNAVVKTISLTDQRTDVVAYIKGTGTYKPIIICGHMDTVPYGNESIWHFPADKLTYADGCYYGRGTSDMKSGLAASLYAFKQMAQLQQKPLGDIIFAATADEETGGTGAKALLDTLPLKEADAMIIAEPTCNDLGIASKGTLWMDFEIYGKSSHGAYPERGINAIDIAFKIHKSLQKICSKYEHPLLQKPTCTLTEISGGSKINMVADCCNMKLDIRTIPALNNELFLQQTKFVCDDMMQQYNGLKINMNILGNRPVVAIEKNHPMVKTLFNIINETRSAAPMYRGINFFSDASIFVQKERELPCILFGPGKDSNAHITDEYVEKEDYFTSILCYNKLLRKYFE